MFVGNPCPNPLALGNYVAVPVQQEQPVLEARGDNRAVGPLGRQEEAAQGRSRPGVGAAIGGVLEYPATVFGQ